MRTPRARRRSQKRRLQLGGVESVLTRYPTLDALNAAIGTAVSRGTLAIPSQKRGICVTDAITASLWYSDYLGEWLWAHYIYGGRRPGIDTAGVEQGTLVRDNPVDSFMKLSALRVVNIMQQGAEVPKDRGVLARQPSAQPFRDLPTGEVCSNILAFMARDPLYSASDYFTERASHGIRTEYTSEAAGRIVEAVLPRGSTLVSADFCRDKTCVAVLINSALHAVACVLVNGVWHFMDNEVGVAIPLRGITLAQIESASFSFTFDFTQADSMSYFLYLNSNAWRGGQLGSWTVTRKYTSNEYASGATFPHQEDLSARRYLCVTPRALQADGAVHREVVETDVPMVDAAPRQKTLADIVGDLAGVRFHSKRSSARRSYLTSESEAVVLRVSSLASGGTYRIQVNGVDVGVFTPNDRRRPTNRLWKVTFHTEQGQMFPGILDLTGITPQNRGMMRILLTILNRQNQQTDVTMSDEEAPPPRRPVAPVPEAERRADAAAEEEGYRMALEAETATAPAPPPLGWSPATQTLAQLVQRRPDPDLYTEIETAIRAGGDLNQKDERGLTPFHALVRTKRDLFSIDPTRIQTLVNGFHADVTTRDLQANTVFHTVARTYTSDEMEAILPQLMDLTRDINARNKDFDTPMDVVLKRRDRTDAMVAAFRKYGAVNSTQPRPSGGRRKTVRRRRSSLPTRKAPSSGHSRRYSRRRRASRS